MLPKRMIILASISVIAAGIGLAGFVQAQTTALPRGPHDISAQEKAQRASVSPQQVAEWARAHAGHFYTTYSGSPEVVLTRPVLASELPRLGLPFGGARDGEPPLVLVVLRGDLGVKTPGGTSLVRGGTPEPIAATHVPYVGLVYDLWARLPTAVYASPRGGIFRQVLNDPGLTDDSPIAAGPTAKPGDEIVRNPVIPPGVTPVSGVMLPAPSPPPGVQLTPMPRGIQAPRP